MADVRTLNEKYAIIGADLIDKEPSLQYIKDSSATIVYLSSELKKTDKQKLVLGQCERVAEKYKWGLPCDFTITVFEPNVEELTEEQIRILIFHELLHVGIKIGADGEETYFCRPHDLEDFKEIIDRFGSEWNYVKGQDFVSEEVEFES